MKCTCRGAAQRSLSASVGAAPPPSLSPDTLVYDPSSIARPVWARRATACVCVRARSCLVCSAEAKPAAYHSALAFVSDRLTAASALLDVSARSPRLLRSVDCVSPREHRGECESECESECVGVSGQSTRLSESR